MGSKTVICHSPTATQWHLAEITVALAAKTHWMQSLSLGDDDEVRSRLTDSLIGGSNPGVARIYDSIAAILVSQPRHEHIAATMHFHHPRNAILLLTNNLPFEAPRVHSYLRKVWKLLGNLSHAFSVVRLQVEEPSMDRQALFFHALHDQRVSPLINDLKVVIYTHAAAKFHWRINKRWEEFLAFTKALKTIVNDPDIPQAEPNMSYINLVRVSEFLEFLRDRPVDKDFFVRIVDGFNAAASELTNVQLEEWSTLVYWHHPGETRPFPLRRYLEKIRDLNRHIRALISYAHSPHLRHYFNMDLFLKLDIPREEFTISIPRSVSEWSIVTEAILDPVEVELIDPDTVLQRVVFGYSHTKDPVPACVHSEIRLLHYIHSIGHATGQIYIGLNKPSCMGCYFYFRNHNKYHPEGHVSTRDPHDKYVFPWNLPGETESTFRRDVFQSVAEDLHERFVMFGFTKTRIFS